MREDIIKSYNETNEKLRLQSTQARKVEYLTTIHFINRYIKKNSYILDCGCGYGIYSKYLAKNNKVTAIDLVPKHINSLKEEIIKNNLNINAFCCDAINLKDVEDNQYDVVLCMGPLYHLKSKNEQIKCISECIKKLKKDGVLFVSYLNKYSVFPCVIRGNKEYLSESVYTKIIDQQYIDSTDRDCFWTDNYFHAPKEIECILKNEHLSILNHVATDGQSIAFQTVINSLTREEFKTWFKYHMHICQEKAIIGTSNHGLIIAKRIEDDI